MIENFEWLNISQQTPLSYVFFDNQICYCVTEVKALTIGKWNSITISPVFWLSIFQWHVVIHY